MAVEEISARLRARLQEEYGLDEAAILMDRPPGGWGDLITNQSLDRRFSEFEARLDARFDAIDRKFDAIDRKFDAIDRKFEAVDARFEAVDAKFDGVDAKFEGVEGRIILELHRELRVQTWRFVTTTIAALTSLTGATAIFVAIATSQ